MRSNNTIGVSLLCTIFGILALLSSSALFVAAQSTEGVALQRGYRTGYSDGYMAGYRDTIDSLGKGYGRHSEYSKASRAYNPDYGSMEDYKDGYQQGFENGYDTGFERRGFDQNLPTNLKRRGGVLVGESADVAAINTSTTQSSGTTTEPTAVQNTSYTDNDTTTANTRSAQTYPEYNNATILIPRDTELILELEDDLSTERSRTGDKFTAKIVSPSEIAGATIEGRVAKIISPGRIKRRSELVLSFDRILLSDNRWSNFSGTLIEVMPVKGDNVKRVDNEGTAVGRSSLKSDAAKVGGATVGGLVVGGLVGGPVGAAVGAGMGAAFGVGAVVIERGKHIRLGRNQQLRIKTAYETQIR